MESGGEATAGSAGQEAGWQHPGLWLTSADLLRLQAQVAAGAEPWAETRDSLVSTANKTQSSGAVAHQGDGQAYAMQDGGNNILKLALAWVLTGDLSYGEAARDKLNEWSVYQDGGDGLRNGVGAATLVNAAEIIRHASVNDQKISWPAEEIAAFEAMLLGRLAPLLRKYGDGGWGTPCLNGLIAIAAFCEDRELYAETIEVFENGPSAVNPSLTVCCGVLEMIGSTGQSYDSGRDQGHAQFLLGHLFQTAITAFHQGVNLFTYGDSRLLAGMEYSAQYNLGEEVPYAVLPHCGGDPPWGPTISSLERGKLYPQYEAAVAFYEGVLGASAPYSKQVTARPDYFPEKNNTDAFGYGALLYRGKTE